MSNSEPVSPRPLTICGIDIPVAEQSPLVLALVAIIQQQAAEILQLREEIQLLRTENQQLRDEIHRLNKTTGRPKIKPSRLLDPPKTPQPRPTGPPAKRPGSAKRKKTRELLIDQIIELHPLQFPTPTRPLTPAGWSARRLKVPRWKAIATTSSRT